MKKVFCAFVFLLVLTISPPAALARDINAFEYGIVYNYFDYEEDLVPPYKSTESGWLPGMYLGYIHEKPKAFYMKSFMEFSWGKTDYDGTTQAGTPVKDTTDNSFFRLEMDIGYTFGLGNSAICPYVGLGYRTWTRGLGGPYPYDEKYSWRYVPVGVNIDFNVNSRLNIGANFSLRYMFNGEMEPKSSYFEAGKGNLGNKRGYFAELPVYYKLSSYISLIATPWYAYREIGKSDYFFINDHYASISYYAYEPDSTTYQYGTTIRLVWEF
ncbi:MAG: autotransporter domain-containing protein [Deltaproteobacteria bacterium]|nr:autotransporter domain-containing protein [Deltaproteobacteria bacterium]